MSTQPNDLDSLRRAYARGELDAVTYRNVRRALLVSIQGGALPASPLRPLAPPPLRPSELAPPAASAASPPALAAAPAPPLELPPHKRPAWLLGAVGAGVLVVIGLAVGLMNGSDDAATIAVDETIAAPSAEERALDAFLQEADWSAARVTSVLAVLERLQESPVRSESSQVSIARLQRATSQRVEEQAALRMIDGASDAAQAELLALARALDVNTDALIVADAPALVPPAAPAPPAAAPVLPENEPATAPLPAPAPVAEMPPAVPLPSEVKATPATEPSAGEKPTSPASPAIETPSLATTTVPATPDEAPTPAKAEAPAERALEPFDAAKSIATRSPTALAAKPEPGIPPMAAATLPATLESKPETAAAKTASSEEKTSPAAPAVAGVDTASRKGCNALTGAKLDARRIPSCRDPLAAGGDGPMMLGVPGGTFTMGGRRPEEQPTREVRIPYALAVAKYETSWAEYRAFAAATGRVQPPGGDNPSLPVSGVTWDDASAFANWLSNQSGARYRLPTEAEWEYLARAGADTRWPDGNDSFPNTVVASVFGPRERPEVVMRGWTNRFKLVHMLGNVAEWVEDAWQPSLAGAPADGGAVAGVGQRVVRGGAFRDDKETVTLSARSPHVQDSGAETIGFRVVRELR